MPTPPQAERINFWKFAYARASFNNARDLCKALLGRPPDIVRNGLSIAAMVTYARPFKQKPKPPVRLTDAIVPQKHRAIHDELITFRDKVIAHRDVDGPPVPWGIVSELIIDSDGSELSVHTVSLWLTDEKALALIDLADELIEVCAKEAFAFLRNYIKSVPPLGAYTVSLEENPPDWLIWKSRSESENSA